MAFAGLLKRCFGKAFPEELSRIPRGSSSSFAETLPEKTAFPSPTDFTALKGGIRMKLRIAAAALLLALIVTGSMKSKLKSVHRKRSASEYMKRDSLNMVDASEIYLYSNVTRTYIDRDRDSHSGGGGGVHISSSGTTHGGGGGHF